MVTTADLRARAAECRALAQTAHESTAVHLLALAEEWEAEAARLEPPPAAEEPSPETPAPQ